MNVIEERLGRHILVATRAYRVGTSGHIVVPQLVLGGRY